MPTLSDHIENALNEGRMLMLGGQVLLGFSYDICYEGGFDRAPLRAQLAEMGAIGLLTVALGWVLWPAAFHCIAERGMPSKYLHRFITRVLDWALLPLGLSLGFAFYAAAIGMHIAHPWIAGVLAGTVTLAAWYIGGMLPHRHPRPTKDDSSGSARPDLGDRIKKVLIECRMALPGAQAFLGFQFAIIFSSTFERLPRSSQLVHFATLLCTTAAIVLLIAPAAYHRLAEAGEDSEHFYTVASRLLIAALAFLPIGMCGDLFVTLRKVTGSDAVSLAVPGFLVATFYTLWFGVSIRRRSVRRRRPIRHAA